MLLRVDESQLTAVGAQMMGSGIQGVSVSTTTLAPATGIAPAAADEVSQFAAFAYSAQTAALHAANIMAQQEIARYGGALMEAAGAYTATDAATAAIVV